MAYVCLKPGANKSKNAKQMRNTKQNCFSHSSASPCNNKQCSAKQCFANQTNWIKKSSKSYSATHHFGNHVHNHVISDILLIGCFAHILLKHDSRIKQCFLFRSDADDKPRMCLTVLSLVSCFVFFYSRLHRALPIHSIFSILYFC